ncbi:MAG: DUF1614 domain-containing protein [Thermoplasmatota archaeon]
MPPLDALPWPILLAAVSLALIYVLYRRRAEAFAELSLSGREIALLTLGSIAGSAVSVPIVPFGETYLSVNLGGALMPIFFAIYWMVKRKLSPIPLAIVAVVVSFVAFRVVSFDPDQGIISAFPYFFLPSLFALGLGLAFSWFSAVFTSWRGRDAGDRQEAPRHSVKTAARSARWPMRSVPLAYVGGSVGALLGADVYNLPRVAEFYRANPGPGRIEIGGAGVFDMVFLAGTVSMAAQLVLVLAFTRRAASPVAAHESLGPLAAGNVETATGAAGAPSYGGSVVTLRDSRRAWEQFIRLPDPTPLERATAALALSNLALREGDYAKSVRMSGLAVATVVEKMPVDLALSADARRDIDTLERASAWAQERELPATQALTREEAGNANHTAKLLVASLAHVPGVNGRPSRLEGL